jgi:hypothetical protein
LLVAEQILEVADILILKNKEKHMTLMPSMKISGLIHEKIKVDIRGSIKYQSFMVR